VNLLGGGPNLARYFFAKAYLAVETATELGIISDWKNQYYTDRLSECRGHIAGLFNIYDRPYPWIFQMLICGLIGNFQFCWPGLPQSCFNR